MSILCVSTPLPARCGLPTNSAPLSVEALECARCVSESASSPRASRRGSESARRNRPKILFVCSGLNFGGAERQWSLLIPPIRDRGYDASVLTLVDQGPYFDELVGKGVSTTCARMRGRLDVVGFLRALRHVRVQPDLVVTHSINAHVVGHLIARRAAAPHVSTEHGGPGVPTRVHRRALARLIGPRVDRAIAVSNAQIPGLVALAYRPDRIRIIQNAVPELRPSEPPQEVRHRLGIGSGDVLAVLAATLRPEKMPDVFVKAVQEASRMNARVKGLIIGGGPELERLRNLVGNNANVRLLGARTDVVNILNAADVVCLSSSAEGVPMVILEAMALGKPVIATNVGGIPEAVRHHETGLLVPSGDTDAFATALLEVAANRALTARLAAGARERHSRVFGFDKMIDAYARVFDEVLECRP